MKTAWAVRRFIGFWQRFLTGLFMLFLAPVFVAPVAAQAVEFEALGQGVYLHQAQPGPATRENQARTGNIAFVVGPTGVVVWNSGVSYFHGQQVVGSVLQQVNRPIRLLLVSHAYQDVLFGWRAFTEIGIDFWMHEGAHKLMHSRCHQCLGALNQMLGFKAMFGTTLGEPTRLLTRGERIDKVTGRPLEILEFGFSSGPNDLALFDHDTGTLFAGPLVMTTQMLQMRDARMAGWLKALDQLVRLPVKRVVPDYGAPGTAKDIVRTREYLIALDARARQLLKDGTSLSAVADKGDLEDFSNLQGYEIDHPRNVHQIYLRLEQEFFNKN